MEWRDEGIVLGMRLFGESGAIVTLLTREHGRHAGLARGGAGRRGRSLYQTGNRVAAQWRARLGDQLGSLSAELIEAHGARLIDDARRLAALASAAALAEAALPEREPHRAVYDRLLALLQALQSDEAGARWPEWITGACLLAVGSLRFCTCSKPTRPGQAGPRSMRAGSLRSSPISVSGSTSRAARRLARPRA